MSQADLWRRHAGPDGMCGPFVAIVNEITGANVELPAPVEIHINDLDQWYYDHQRRFAAEWNEQHPDNPVRDRDQVEGEIRLKRRPVAERIGYFADRLADALEDPDGSDGQLRVVAMAAVVGMRSIVSEWGGSGPDRTWNAPVVGPPVVGPPVVGPPVVGPTVVYEVGDHDYEGIQHRALFTDRALAEEYAARYGPLAEIEEVHILAEAPSRITVHHFNREVHRDGSFGPLRHHKPEEWTHETGAEQWTTPGRHNLHIGPRDGTLPAAVYVTALDEQEGLDLLADECHRLSALAEQVEGSDAD